MGDLQSLMHLAGDLRWTGFGIFVFVKSKLCLHSTLEVQVLHRTCSLQSDPFRKNITFITSSSSHKVFLGLQHCLFSCSFVLILLSY